MTADEARPGLGRGFALLLSASAVSTVGNGLATAAFPLLAARLTSDPFLVSVVTAAGTMPWLVFGLLSGVVVDRTDRRLLMWRTDAARAVLVGGLVLALVTVGVHIWALALFAAAVGVGTTLFDNASQAMVPALVGIDDEPLGRANARLYGSEVAGEQFAGPALGGILFAAAQFLPFALDAVSFAVSAALVAAVGGRYRADGPSAAGSAAPSWRRSMAEGVMWLVRHHFLRSLAVAIGTINLAIAMGEAVLVLLAERSFHLHAAGYGLLVATLAVGGFTASVVSGTCTRRWHRSAVLRASLVILAGGILLAGLAPDAYACAVGLALVSFAAVLFSVVAVSLRQALIPDAVMGRVVSAFRVIGMGATPVGALLGGVVARQFGLRAPYVVAAVLIAAVAALTWSLLSRRSLDRQRATA